MSKQSNQKYRKEKDRRFNDDISDEVNDDIRIAADDTEKGGDKDLGISDEVVNDYLLDNYDRLLK